MESFPENAWEIVSTAISEVLARTVEEVYIDGKSYKVYARQRTYASDRVGLRLLGASNDFSDSTVITLLVDVIQKPRQEPRKEAPLFPEGH